MTRRPLKFMLYLTAAVILFGATVGNWLYQDAVQDEELNDEIRQARQRGYSSAKGE